MSAPLHRTAGLGHCIQIEPPSEFEHGYLLIDPGATVTDTASLDALYGVTCQPRNWGQRAVRMPQLVDLAISTEEQRKLIKDILREEQLWRAKRQSIRPVICAQLQSDLSVQYIARHLASQMLVLPMNVEGSYYTTPSLWRFHDPRVFANLTWMLPAERLARLFGPVSSWTFPWLTGWYQCQSEQLPEPAADEEEPLHASGLLPINLDLWQRTQRNSMINRVLTRIGSLVPQPYADLVGVARQIEAALLVAITELHWVRPDDACGYAEFVLRFGERFTSLPGVVQFCQQQRSGLRRAGFAKALGSLSAEERAALQLPALDAAPEGEKAQ